MPYGPATYALEERRTADGSLVRAVNLGPDVDESPFVSMSPDAHALLLQRILDAPAPRIIVFD